MNLVHASRYLHLSALLAVACADADPEKPASPADAGVAPAAVPARRPNILLIVADDLGYSDIGAFGGEIPTPALDALAAEGRVLTDHHTAATCSPTRAMLMSGTDHHLAGLGTMAELLQPEQKGKPGYEGYLNARSLSVAELLRDGGYHTYIAGKWHLGTEEEHSPAARGFEQSYVLVGGAASHFAPVPGKPTAGDSGVYRENGKLTKVPEYFFSSNFFTDRLIDYIGKNRGDGKPFFAYAAYTAPHWPLQAPADFIDRHRGRYDAGYDAIRAQRIARQKQLGIVPPDFQVNPGLPSTPENPTWSDLPPEGRRLEARRMEIYAAMVENLDHNIGRLIRYLKEIGEYEDTFVFFMSDNGAEGAKGFPDNANTDNSFENLGRPLSNVIYGKRWAEVGATPFRLWKGYSTEGGVVVPAIARLPHQRSTPATAASKLEALTHVTDLAPTFLALARSADPGSRYAGREVNPITGHSLLPALRNERPTARPAGTSLVDELFGRRYVRRDQWKLTWLEAPLGSGGWALYDLAVDRAETKDLSSARPDLVNALTAEWDDYARKTGVVLPLVVGMPGRE